MLALCRYGQDFDVRTEVQPINIAYTNAELDLHMDLPYYESPPGIQMLHCIENDKTTVKGGESLFMDVHHCAELFREEDPEGFQTLCEVPATFVKDHLERTHPAQMFCRRPHFEVDPTNGDLLAVFWSPNFEGKWPVSRGGNAVGQNVPTRSIVDRPRHATAIFLTLGVCVFPKDPCWPTLRMFAATTARTTLSPPCSHEKARSTITCTSFCFSPVTPLLSINDAYSTAAVDSSPAIPAKKSPV